MHARRDEGSYANWVGGANGTQPERGGSQAAAVDRLLAPWPLARKPSWVDHVKTPLTEAELAAVQRSVQWGCPFGDAAWSKRTVRRLGLESTLRPPGRPKIGS